MRNKKRLIYSVLIVSSLLTACGKNTEPTIQENNNVSEQKPGPEETVPNKDNPETEQPQQTTETVVSDVKSELKMEKALIPSYFPIDKNKHLTAAIDENSSDNYKVVFFQSDQILPINDSTLSSQGNIPIIATFQAKTYQDSASFKDLFPPTYFDNYPDDLNTELGYGIQGIADAGMGHRGIEWQEGNWNLKIDSLAVDDMDNTGIAKKIVTYLEKNMLPAPKEKGRVNIQYKLGGQDVLVHIYWQDGTTIYQLETVKVPLDALEMVVSVN